jgi:hypothetical protein
MKNIIKRKSGLRKTSWENYCPAKANWIANMFIERYLNGEIYNDVKMLKDFNSLLVKRIKKDLIF